MGGMNYTCRTRLIRIPTTYIELWNVFIFFYIVSYLNFHLIQWKVVLMSDFELTVPDL